MVKINWTKRAVESIYEIQEYLLTKSESFVKVFTDKIFEKVDLLINFPESGRMLPELERPDIRELIYKNYRIIYKIVSEEEIDILFVHNSYRPLNEDSLFAS